MMYMVAHNFPLFYPMHCKLSVTRISFCQTENFAISLMLDLDLELLSLGFQRMDWFYQYMQTFLT